MEGPPRLLPAPDDLAAGRPRPTVLLSGAQPGDAGDLVVRSDSTLREYTPRSRGLVIDLNPLLEPEALRRIGRGTLTWLAATVGGAALVVYLLGPTFSVRDQRALTQELLLRVSEAVGAVQNSLGGAILVTQAPAIGDPVALIQVPRLRLQQAVSEGADSKTLRSGPGHVPGTAGLGQPGNSVVVGRRSAFGGPFGRLRSLHPGDKIVVSTTQGQSVYTVTGVGATTISDRLYAPTKDDQLTLLSGASWWPLNGSHGGLLTAKLDGQAFVPTPQNGRSVSSDGRHGDGSAWPLLVLELLALVVTVAASTVLYRKWSGPATYLVSTPALLALLVFVSLTGVRLLPGWF
jgi:sortase A